MAHPNPHQQRLVERSIKTGVVRPSKAALIEEKDGVADRLADLSTYISSEEFYDVDGRNQQLLQFQESLMTQLSMLLERRILFFRG